MDRQSQGGQLPGRGAPMPGGSAPGQGEPPKRTPGRGIFAPRVPGPANPQIGQTGGTVIPGSGQPVTPFVRQARPPTPIGPNRASPFGGRPPTPVSTGPRASTPTSSASPAQSMMRPVQPATVGMMRSIGRGRIMEANQTMTSVGDSASAYYTPPASIVSSRSVTPMGHACSSPIPGAGFISPAFSTMSLADTGAIPKVRTQLPVKSSPHPESKQTAQQPDVRPGTAASKEPAMVQRHGTKGNSVSVSTNFIKIKFEEGRGIYEYAVRMEPQVDDRQMRRRVLRCMESAIGKIFSFDGAAKLLLPIKLEHRITVVDTFPTQDQNNPVTVRLQFLHEKFLGDPEGMQLLNILFRQIPEALNFVRFNRNYYDPNDPMVVKEYKLEVWPGYVTSVNNYEDGLLLQCDVSHRILRNETAYDILKCIFNRSRNDLQKYQDDAKRELVGNSVITRYSTPARVYRIDDIDFKQNPRSTFSTKSGDISYHDYFKTKYNLVIKDLEQPLMVHRPKFYGANDPREVILVPELCHMTGLSEQMRSDFSVMKAVGTHTRVPPDARQKALKTFLKRVESTPEASRILSNWGIRLDSNAVAIEGRVLEAETLMFGNNATERIRQDGDFTKAATSKRVLQAVNLDNWLLIYPSSCEQVTKKFFQCLQFEANKLGISIVMPRVEPIVNDRPESYIKAMSTGLNDKTQMIFTIVPQQRGDRYTAIKKYCYLEKKIPNQVVVAKTISQDKKLTSVCQKIVLQANAKLGGRLWGLRCPLNGIMMVGIDVFHDPSAKRTDMSSVAGIVASMNQDFSSWYSTVAKQGAHQEIVGAMAPKFLECLTEYYNRNHTLPKVIVVFRDGVGDGQLKAVRDFEVDKFKAVIANLAEVQYVGYNPVFVFVVVQKRINVRLLSLPSTQGGAYSNPAPGTVVDRGITRKEQYDFYLVPQKVTQGTVTPTHLIVLQDHADMPPDRLQKFAYALTFMYYNWTGSVRVPAPCQYAHKLCKMVGETLKNVPPEEFGRTLYYL